MHKHFLILLLLLLRLRYFLRAALQTGHLTTQCTTYCWNRWQFSWRFKELQTMWWVSSLWPWFSWVEKNKFFFLLFWPMIGQLLFNRSSQIHFYSCWLPAVFHKRNRDVWNRGTHGWSHCRWRNTSFSRKKLLNIIFSVSRYFDRGT